MVNLNHLSQEEKAMIKENLEGLGFPNPSNADFAVHDMILMYDLIDWTKRTDSPLLDCRKNTVTYFFKNRRVRAWHEGLRELERRSHEDPRHGRYRHDLLQSVAKEFGLTYDPNKSI